MYRLIVFLTIFNLTFSCAQPKGKIQSSTESKLSNPDSAINEQKLQLAKEFSQKKIEYFIIHVPEDQYGYYIMIDGQMYIEQKTIPAIEGNKGFKTKEDAKKIADLVIQKIREGEIPPTITVEDLKAHNVIDN